MRTPSSLLLLALAATTAAGCAPERKTVDVCGRGDRDALGDALADGELELTFRDAEGAVLVRTRAGVDGPSARALAIPADAAEVEVVGRDATGAAIARGASPIDGDRACVCFALDAHHQAVCAGVGCTAESGSCSFFDRDSGGPADRRTIVLGDNASDDVHGVTFDTTLSAEDGERDRNFGGGERLRASVDPARTTLVRFDLGALPSDVSVESAELELVPCAAGDCAASGAAAVFPILEEWSEGDEDGATCATWNCRTEGIAWSVPGCGYLSERNRAREGSAAAQIALTGPGLPVSFDVTGEVARWLRAPEENFGLAIAVDEESAVDFASSEAPPDFGARPRLRIAFRITSEDPALPPDAGPDSDAALAGDAGTDDSMIAIPAGAFLMGCDPSVVDECDGDEVPLHAVTLSAYEIDRTEVTQAQYAACVDAGACPEPECEWDPEARGAYPVTCVTWSQAVGYCEFAGKRLPTEAEWEKAARGVDGRLYPWGNEPPSCTLANAFGCAGAVQPVGIRPLGASPYGLLDMSGNATEYVADYYRADYYETSPSVDPTGPATGNRRVRRGGGFGGSDPWLTTFIRVAVGQAAAKPHFGFRCAR